MQTNHKLAKYSNTGFGKIVSVNRLLEMFSLRLKVLGPGQFLKENLFGKKFLKHLEKLSESSKGTFYQTLYVRIIQSGM